MNAEKLFVEMKRDQAKRLRISFDTDEKAEGRLQIKIFDSSRKIT